MHRIVVAKGASTRLYALVRLAASAATHLPRLCSRQVGRVIAPTLHTHRSSSSSSGAHLPAFAALLQPSHGSIIRDEQKMLADLHTCLRGVDANKDALELVSDTRSRIDDLFLIVICGEFNAGKSTLINALVGADLLQSGVLPTTVKICVLRSPSDATGGSGGSGTDTAGGVWRRADNMLLDDVDEMEVPLKWMKHIAIVDTPGTNAIIAKHEQLTQKIIPRADLVLFVTSAERPMTESESSVLERISQWGKKVVMIVNKMDILPDAKERQQVLDYVAQHSAKLLGTTKVVPVFGVSGRLALTAKLVNPNSDPSTGTGAGSWEESKFAALEQYLSNVLGQKELIRSKLENPLGVADRVIADTVVSLDARLAGLDADLRVLEMIDDNMAVFKTDIERDVLYYRQHVKLLVAQITERCERFVEDNVTIFKPSLLMDSKQFQSEFQQAVLMDVTKPIDDVLVEMSDLISTRSRMQARSVMEFVGTRPKKYSDSMIGHINAHPVTNDAQFDAMKSELVERLRRDVKVVLMNNDQEKNIARMSEAVKFSVFQTAAVQAVSAASVGALLAAHVLDVTGIVAASSAAVASLIIVPWKRSSVRNDFAKRMDTLQGQLDTVIGNNFERELQAIGDRIKHAIAPYSRFVQGEKKKVEESLAQLGTLRESVRDLKKRI